MISEVYHFSQNSYYKVKGHLMSIRARIDFSVSFSYKVFYKGICVKSSKKTTRLKDLVHFVGFPHFLGLSLFWELKRFSLHHFTVEFKVFSGLEFFKAKEFRV